MSLSSGDAALMLVVLLLGAAAAYITHRHPTATQPLLVALGVLTLAAAVAGAVTGS
ncbi:hypothetical protein [Streptomyces olivochromogenes]|uniref:hypothetical protein n=1 Tax=Streptomyces olivochromogenes TaxID=1963 RepID=UPI001F359F9E|nr:hypothetical protein [Streptomyces olivochromogenes]MCF3132413.1 hypothetical protein [Streptomyces olivochromogenes]